MADDSTATLPSAGLMAGTTPVPLEGVSVEAHISGPAARVTIAQRYRNTETQPIEAIYVFPLDEGAAVCGFEAISAGVHYVGEVLEREAAFERYDEAMAAGHGAYLLDEERPDIFTANLGNLPPGGEVLIRLTYVTELTLEGDAVRFTLPTTVSPRYAPAEDRQGLGRPDAEVLNPPVAWRVPYGLDLTVHLDLGHPITRVDSPSHPIAVTIEGTKATVTFANEHAALDRDFVLLAGPSGVDRPAVFVERDEDGRHAALVAFQPVFDVDRVPAEVIFLVDRSGSMGGSSIEQVRNALQLCLRSLNAGCRFNIVGFGSTFEALFPESRPYDEGSLRVAAGAVATLDADLGGTEILPALQFVLERPPVDGLARQVVVLTDGEVTNTDAVIALAGRHAARARVFTFGIGRGASHHLVRGLARAGKGTAEFIYPGERVEAKVMRQFARLLSPVLADVSLTWKGAAVTQAPHALPPVFAGERLLAYAILEDARPATVTLTGTTPKGPVSFTVAVDRAAATPGRTIVTLAARTLIRELEEGGEWLEARGSRQKRRKENRVKDEIVRLATAYRLASRETSFVAVERRETPIEDQAVLRRIPVALTSGWGASEEMGVDACLSPAMPAPTQAWDTTACHLASPSYSREDDSAIADYAEPAEIWAPEPAFQPAASPSWSPADPASAPAPRPLDELVRLQRADGTWDLSDELARVIGIALAEIEATMGTSAGDAEARMVWATTLALGWLERHESRRRRQWTMLADKAEQWLKARARDNRDAQGWIADAQGFRDRQG